MTELLPTVYLPLLAVALYAVAMWLYRRCTAGESFDIQKLLQALGLGAIATLALYFANGSVPGVDLVLQYMAQYAGNNGTLTAIMAVLWALIDQYIIKGKALGTPLVSSVSGEIKTEQAKTTLSGSPSFSAGIATVLGLCRDSVDNAPATPTLTFDVNQVPNLFYQLQCVTPGKVMTAILVDDINLTDSGEEGIDMKTAGQKISRPFFLPQKLRKAGTRVVTVKQGHLAGTQNLIGGTDSKVVWDSSASFALVLTGTKASD